MAPRGDCGAPLLAKLPAGSVVSGVSTISSANCIPLTAGINSSGQQYCTLAINGRCAVAIVFGNSNTGPQSRDGIVAAINNSNRFCFAICGGAPVEGSKITNLNGDVRVCVINSANTADC